MDSLKFNYTINTAAFNDIINHLRIVDSLFIPKLSSVVDLNEYAKKIFEFSMRFECWDNNQLIGLVSFYNNFENIPFSYITNVSVFSNYYGKGIASKLLINSMNFIKVQGISKIDLSVNKFNLRAIKFYESFDFKVILDKGDSLLMSCVI